MMENGDQGKGKDHHENQDEGASPCSENRPHFPLVGVDRRAVFSGNAAGPVEKHAEKGGDEHENIEIPHVPDVERIKKTFAWYVIAHHRDDFLRPGKSAPDEDDENQH